MANDLSKDYKSRAKIMMEIMEALKDDKISIIALCGPGGVGKTTLIHELRERVKVDGLFNEIAMAVVSQTPDLLDIQRRLAEMLGLTNVMDSENRIAIADEIHKRLTGKQRKTLVILDDIWGEINLAELGIPVGSDQPQCKVVLTSRNSRICTQMNSQKIISVETMPPDEAWNLFKKKAGNCVESDDLKKIAEEVAHQCGGLPIALVTVAGALRDNKAKEIWKDALKQLKDHRVTTIEGMDRKVYLSIKLSYDFLAREVPEAKLLLLFSCQYPEDAEIRVEILARYCLALRLLKDVETLCETRNRVSSIMEHLKGRFLLEAVDVDDNDKKLGLDRVKMHDIVRYVGCSIVSSLKVERDEVYMQMCNGKKKVNDSYDAGAEDLTKLRMLTIARGCNLGDIWSKIGRQTELEILECRHSAHFESLFPHQIKQLIHLKLLDLRFRTITDLVPITRGILPELKNLEMLFLGTFYFKIEPEESDACITELNMLPNLISLQVQLLSLEQLLSLPLEKLERFSISIISKKQDLRYGEWNPLIWRTLDVTGFRMDLIVGDKIRFILRMTEDLLLRKTDWIDRNWVGLFTKLQYLYLSDMNELTTICQTANLPVRTFGNLRRLYLDKLSKLRQFLGGPTDTLCFAQLQNLTVYDCPILEEIVSKADVKATGKVGEIIDGASDFILHFPNLRVVRIIRATSFGGLYNIYEQDSLIQPLVHPLIMLPSLEELHVSNLDQLKQIAAGRNTDFSKYVTSDWLQNLQVIKVQSCNSLESMFDFEVMAENELVVKLGKLQNIQLEDLPNLTCIFRCRMQNIFIPQLQKIEVVECNKLRNLVASNLIKLLQSLRQVKIEYCETLEAVFDFDRFGVMNDDANFILGELQAIDLINLPNLEHLCRLPPKEIHVFQNLTQLSVDKCASLKYLLSSSIAQSLVCLEHLIIRVCKSMNECIRVDEEHSGEKIVFRSLKSITLKRMGNLSSFCSSDQQEFEFPSLEKVVIFGCPQMKTFCHGRLTAHKLHGVEFLDVKNLQETDHSVSGDVDVWKNDLNETIRHIYKRTLEDWDDLLCDLMSFEQVNLPTMEILEVRFESDLRHIVGAESIDIQKIVASNWLRNLREINITFCYSLESLFNFEGKQFMAENAHVVTLSELQKISLKRLLNLACIFRCRMQDISIPKLQDIDVTECNKLVNLFASTFIKLLHSLKHVTLRHCKSMEAVFDFEGLEVMSKDSNVLLGKLQHIEVESLPKLEHVCRLPPKEVSVFPNLTKLDVRSCDSLSYLISSSVAQSLVNLESLYIMECKSMEVCIRMEEKDYSGKQIVFCSLKSIELCDLDKLSSFCASDLQMFEFPSLERLVIIDCPELKTFCFGLMTADKLCGVEFVKGKSVWMSNLNETLRHFNTSDGCVDNLTESWYDDSNADDLNDIQCDNEGTSFPNASLASSSMQNKAEKASFDSTSYGPDDDQKWKETVKEELIPLPHPLETLEHETAVPASPHALTLSSIEEKRPIPPQQNPPSPPQSTQLPIPRPQRSRKLQTSKSIPTLLPTDIQATTPTPTHQTTSASEAVSHQQIASQDQISLLTTSQEENLTALISQLIISQQALQTQLSQLLHTQATMDSTPKTPSSTSASTTTMATSQTYPLPVLYNPNAIMGQTFLTKDNYVTWSTLFKTMLRTHKLLFVIDPEQPPAMLADGSVNPRHELWSSATDLVCGWIKGTVTPPIQPYLNSSHTAPAAWSVLAKRFGATSALRIENLKEKLYTLKKETSVPISDYLLSAINIADSLTSARDPVDDKELIQCILGGLGHEDKEFLTSTSTA